MRKIHHLDSVSSTNTVARRLAQQGAESGEVVWAEWQSAGRGRRGKTWRCPKGKGILASIIIRPTGPSLPLPMLSLAAALAVAEAIERNTRVPAQTKWPNDVLIRGKKVAGILVEASSPSPRQTVPYAIVGIGVNANFRLADLLTEMKYPGQVVPERVTTLLDELGKEVDRSALLTQTVELLEDNVRLIENDKAPQLLSAWRKKDAFLGKVVEVQMGNETLQGTYQDVAEDGSLVLLSPDGSRRHLPAGELSELRPQSDRSADRSAELRRSL